MKYQKTFTQYSSPAVDISRSISVPLIIANTLFTIGVLLIAWGFYNYWKGDPQGIILLVPGLFSVIMGWIFDSLVRKWCE